MDTELEKTFIATRMRQNLAIITAFAPLIRKGIYKKIDEEAAEFLVENVKNIGSKELNYRKYFINDFFAVDFVEKFLEKYNKANLSLKDLKSGDIMSGEKLDKGQKMHSNIVSDDKINYTYLKDIAQELKEVKNEAEFYALFGFKNGKTRGNIKTPIKEVEIDLKEAWQHLQDNSKKENRLKLAGGILPTLQTPNVVSIDKNGTYFFYKALKDEKGVLNLVSIELPKSNRLQYKTSYIASKQRLLKIFNEYEVIYKNL